MLEIFLDLQPSRRKTWDNYTCGNGPRPQPCFKTLQQIFAWRRMAIGGGQSMSWYSASPGTFTWPLKVRRPSSFLLAQTLLGLKHTEPADGYASGTCRQIPNLWLYFALEQILPVSFTMNLFFLAVLLSPSPSDRLAASSGWLVPPVVNQVLMLPVYFAALCIAPSAPTTLALTPVALLIRILLCFPYLGCRPKQPGCRERKISPSKVLGERTPDYKLWVAYKPIWMTIVICYTLLQLLHVWRGSVIAFPLTKDIMWAINNDFAISALGYDLLIAMTSLIVWYGTRPTGKIDGE